MFSEKDKSKRSDFYSSDIRWAVKLEILPRATEIVGVKTTCHISDYCLRFLLSIFIKENTQQQVITVRIFTRDQEQVVTSIVYGH